MAKFKEIKALEDGWSDWEFPEMNGYRLGCCDCGLVHDVDFKVVQAVALPTNEFACEEIKDETLRILMRAKRNNRSTAQIRRYQMNDTKRLEYLLDKVGMTREDLLNEMCGFTVNSET